MKDLLLYEDKQHFQIKDLLREPFFTYEQKNTSELFLEMQKNSINIAIVLDEYGVTAGMITLEDLLEEIVGEIRDEYDADEEDPLIQTGEREYCVQGSMNLEDLCDVLNLHHDGVLFRRLRHHRRLSHRSVRSSSRKKRNHHYG